MEEVQIETLFNDLPAENIENSMELLKSCKLACNELKLVHDTETPSNFIKKVKKLPSSLLSVLHYYCLYCKKHDKSASNTDKFYMTLLHTFKTEFYDKFKGRVTLTYGDVAESHAGMQNIGKKSKHGFSLADIQRADAFFKERGCETVIIHLNDFLPDGKLAGAPVLFTYGRSIFISIFLPFSVTFSTKYLFLYSAFSIHHRQEDK